MEEGIPSAVCQAVEGGKETEDGRDGYVVGGGGVGAAEGKADGV